jgi:hypothetical protein
LQGAAEKLEDVLQDMQRRGRRFAPIDYVVAEAPTHKDALTLTFVED